MTKLISRQLKATLFVGSKGSGKSLLMAYLGNELFKSYEKQVIRYPDLKIRAIYSQSKFSQELENKYLGKHLFYWEKPHELYTVKNADIFWDEIQDDLPTASWKDVHPDTKKIFSHLRKRGNRLFANAQNFEDIDISFKRQVDRVFAIYKLMGSKDISASLPAPRRIWGLIFITEYSPLEMRKEEPQRMTKRFGIRRLLRITKKRISFYDTNLEIVKNRGGEFEHREWFCYDPRCMRTGKPHLKIEHYKI